MALPDPDGLDALSLSELRELVVDLIGKVPALTDDNPALRDEVARLNDLPPQSSTRPTPSGMERVGERAQAKPDKRRGPIYERGVITRVVVPTQERHRTRERWPGFVGNADGSCECFTAKGLSLPLEILSKKVNVRPISVSCVFSALNRTYLACRMQKTGGADVDRRSFVTGCSSVAISGLLPGCATLDIPKQQSQGQLVDAHCHVFNSTDLPAARFIRYAILNDYPKQSLRALGEIQDPDFVDQLLELFVHIVTGTAPTAREEIDVLTSRTAPKTEASSAAGASELTVERTTEYLSGAPLRRLDPSLRSISGKRDKVSAAILRAGGQPVSARALPPLEITQAKNVASRAISSNTTIGQYLRWFSLFTRYRYSLVDQLIASHSQQGYRPALISPAIIDYSAWLGEWAESPLADQIEVMGRISARTQTPVHGYVAFDPLREIYFRNGIHEETSPLSLVRSALTDHGFIGVKLYPPMGFRASANAPPYPDAIPQAVKRNLSAQLDAVLNELYHTCVELDACILAHAAESNGANEGYANRADPAYWVPVFRRHPALRVTLAHFGRFSYVSAPNADKPAPLNTWEWTFGQYIGSASNAPVYADLSYLSEVLTAAPDERARIAKNFVRFVSTFDPDVKHLTFGTDWIMLGKEQDSEFYDARVISFLREECGFSSVMMQRLLVSNALRFMGISQASRARERMLTFYRRAGLPENRLLPIEAV